MCSRLFLGMMMMMATRRTERDVSKVIWLEVSWINYKHHYSYITFNSNSSRRNKWSVFALPVFFFLFCLEKKKVAVFTLRLESHHRMGQAYTRFITKNVSVAR